MKRQRHSAIRIYLLGAVLILGAIGVLLLYLRPEPGRNLENAEGGWIVETEEPDEELTKSFDGSSNSLKQTVIVPTLDTPFEQNQSAVWCLSFQMAWNKFKSEVTKGPVRVQNAEPIAERLNRAPESEGDLPPETYFAAAGRVSDGILASIKEEMTKRFPEVRTSEFNLPMGAAVAYAYLRAGVKYQYLFFKNKDPFEFTDSTGKKTAVKSFGIRDQDKYKGAFIDSFRTQVNILGQWSKGDEFAVDLSWRSAPNQIVLARIQRRGTLAEMLKSVEDGIRASSEHGLGDEETLLVPMMHWRIDHHFRELEGTDKLLSMTAGQRLFLATAFQLLQFKLDEKGAELSAEAAMAALDGGPRRFYFDRPFLIYLKKRDAKHPFFVMWVANAELLIKN